MSKTIHTYSFIFVGPVNSGKSTAFDTVVRQSNGCIKSQTLQTITNRYENVDFENGNDIYRLELLDTSGMNMKQSLSRIYFSTTSCVLLFVDLTQQSYRKQIKDIIKTLQRIQESHSSTTTMSSSSGSSDHCSFGFPMVVIGTKSDLATEEEKEQFHSEMNDLHLDSFVCDCLSISSVNDLFNDLLEVDYIHPQAITTVSTEKKKKKKRSSKQNKTCVIM